ncbi:MAG: hypothetical protein L6R42_008854 [Xanthoria sp. 1 TBL-2021]|nr:MAG: hypothetical protein L6R42_008854 [Xanthoria sp. 1 TBL-2021]
MVFTNALSIDSSKTKNTNHIATANTRNTSHISTTTPNHRLSPRQFPFWFPTYEHVVMVAMSVTSAPLFYELLSTLYTYILDTVLQSLASKPDINQLVIEAGDLRWEFGCTMSEPVPVRFLEEYFESRRDAVERGFASVYAREWWWEKGERKRLCFAGMRVVGEGGVVVRPEGRG